MFLIWINNNNNNDDDDDEKAKKELYNTYDDVMIRMMMMIDDLFKCDRITFKLFANLYIFITFIITMLAEKSGC